MALDKPGIAFEKVVAGIQARLDPNALVTHNRFLIDRLGQRRQFDVVIEGKFAGQEMLGIFECRDLSRRVGTPEVDAFVTKAQDLNPNFKVLISRSGFARPAISKCIHYGISPFSLIEKDSINSQFRIGHYWYAEILYWSVVTLSLVEVSPCISSGFKSEEVLLAGKRVIDWFTNYLLEQKPKLETDEDDIEIVARFDTHQMITVIGQRDSLCSAIVFRAKRSRDRRQKFVGISGDGFFDWHTKKARFPPGTEIMSDSVSTDFSTWEPRTGDEKQLSAFVEISLIGVRHQFDWVEDAIDLDPL